MSNKSPMCCVTVGYQMFLMPLKEGTKLLDLLQRAVACEHAQPFDGCFVANTEPLRLELEVVSADRITLQHPRPARRRGRSPFQILENAGADMCVSTEEK